VTITTADRRALILALLEELEQSEPDTRPRELPTADELLAGCAREMTRRGCLPNSIDARRRRVRALMDWAEPRSVLELTEPDIEAYLDSRDLCSNSRRGYLSHLTCFYRWAQAQGHVKTNPVAGIVRPRQRNGQPRPLTDAELAKALDPAGQPDDPIHRRVRCYVLLGAFAGLRCQEIAGLEAHDIDRERNVLRVRKGKGAKERTVPMHPDVLAALEALPMPDSGPIFHQCTNGGARARRSQFTDKPVTAVNVGHAVAWHLRARGIDATAHQLRHSFASRTYQASKDLRLVQELLGHESPTMTARYAAADNAQAAAVVMGLGCQP